MTHKVEIDGAEVEVYTADEVVARETAAKEAAKGEYEPKLTEAQKEIDTVRRLLGERSKEVKEVRRMSDEQVAKLSETERILYENQLVIADQDKLLSEADKKAYESTVDATIRAKVGTDQKLFEKVREMYGMINLEDVTPEQVAVRVNAAFGAVGVTAPDLLAAAGFGGGSFEPPTVTKSDQSFADTERGKALASALGIPTTEEEFKKMNNIQ